MKNLGTVTLETNRLILRKFNIDDGEVMFHNWASDNEVTKYLMWPAHKSLDISKEYIKSLISNYSDSSINLRNLKLRPYEAIMYRIK